MINFARLATIISLVSIQAHIASQGFRWDIGTKWIYEFQPIQHIHTYITNEIVDTTSINGLKMYVVETQPEYSGIRYFHFIDNKVYNYNEYFDILELLYDFSSTEDYQTNYRPICDPDFPYDSLLYKEYTILVDSVSDYIMPDNTSRTLQYVVPQDTVFEYMDTFLITDLNRTILDGIGFMQGGIHYTHNWEIGMYICDEFANFVGRLRCFDNDSISYNFLGYPCDSAWITSSVSYIDRDSVEIFPNPTRGIIYFRGIEHEMKFEIYSPLGVKLEQGITHGKSLSVKHRGPIILRLYTKHKSISKFIYCLNDF